MKNHLSIFSMLLILLVSQISCINHEKIKNNEQPTSTDFEPVDVYLNPNTFENILELKIGDESPKLTIEKWFNGSAVSNFEKDKVYVVEFFASWCQPCRKSIPHLSQLQKEFEKELVVVGVAASENEPNSKKLEKMIAAKSLSLTYRVGYTNDSQTFKDWMWGAKNTGLPWVFIINKKGQIAWFGQPFDTKFEMALRTVINDTYNIEDERIRRESSLISRQLLWEVQEKFWGAYDEENWQEALTLGLQLYSSNDESFYYETVTLFEIYYDKLGQKTEAYEWKNKLLEGYHKNVPEALGFMSKILLEDQEFQESFDQGLILVKQANELTLYKNSELLVTLAGFYERANNLEKAKSNYLKALDYNDDSDLEMEILKKLEGK